MEWTTEELLRLAKESADATDRSESHPARFFRDYYITENLNHRVDADLIYYWYLKWCEEQGEKKPIGRKRFFRKEVGFPQWVKRSSFSGCMKYKLDKSSFKDSPEIREEIRKLWKRKRNKRKEAKQNTQA